MLNQYINVFLPAAIDSAEELAALGIGYTYTTHSWLISYALDCPPNQGVGIP